jgi:hypothetical protein
MLEALLATTKASERKLRLFAVACCRRVWGLLEDERFRRTVETAERHADGGVSTEELAAASTETQRLVLTLIGGFRGRNASRGHAASVAASKVSLSSAVVAARAVTAFCPLAVSGAPRESANPAHVAELGVQADLLRDIIGNPFRSNPGIDREWLCWNGGAVGRLAESAYEERALPEGTLDVGRLAVLADALEEVGCNDPEILSHLRKQGGVHARGCWLVDAVLGKG